MRIFSAILLWISWLILLYAVGSFVLVFGYGPRPTDYTHTLNSIPAIIITSIGASLFGIFLYWLRRRLFWVLHKMTFEKISGGLIFIMISIGITSCGFFSMGLLYLPGIINKLETLMISAIVVGVVFLGLTFPKLPAQTPEKG